MCPCLYICLVCVNVLACLSRALALSVVCVCCRTEALTRALRRIVLWKRKRQYRKVPNLPLLGGRKEVPNTLPGTEFGTRRYINVNCAVHIRPVTRARTLGRPCRRAACLSRYSTSASLWTAATRCPQHHRSPPAVGTAVPQLDGSWLMAPYTL